LYSVLRLYRCDQPEREKQRSDNNKKKKQNGKKKTNFRVSQIKVTATGGFYTRV
jgi:hypothetical protein